MRRSLLRVWLGTIVLAPALTLGCQHARKTCSCATPTTVASTQDALPASTPYAPTTVASRPVAESPALPGPRDVPMEPPLTQTAASAPAPVVVSGPPPMVVPAAHLGSVPSDNNLTTLIAPSPAREIMAGRRTFTDITADPRFAHDAGYRWLVGTLDYSTIQKCWVLRYASVEDDDRYGGSVTLLVSPGRMTTFRSGQLARVEGALLDPRSTQPRPPYRVQALQAVGP